MTQDEVSSSVDIAGLASGIGVSKEFVTKTLEANCCAFDPETDPALSPMRKRIFDILILRQSFWTESMLVNKLHSEAREAKEAKKFFDEEKLRIVVRCLTFRYQKKAETVEV